MQTPGYRTQPMNSPYSCRHRHERDRGSQIVNDQTS
jgi:hypothetical protein